MIAWGASAKDISNRLFISAKTAQNHIQNIYAKTGCTKANELSAWWFCKNYQIPVGVSPLIRLKQNIKKHSKFRNIGKD